MKTKFQNDTETIRKRFYYDNVRTLQDRTRKNIWNEKKKKNQTDIGTKGYQVLKFETCKVDQIPLIVSNFDQFLHISKFKTW